MTDGMTADQMIARARALDQAATEGPWVLIDEEEANESPVARSVQPGITYDADKCDAEFIAAARSMLPAAVEALARVREMHGPSEYGCVSECRDDDGDLSWPCATYRETEVEA